MTDIPKGKYFLVNTSTGRYLFQNGDEMTGNRGDEGGWLSAPTVVGADKNYHNRGYFRITAQGDGKYFIESVKTNRLVFDTGDKITTNGAEGGWLEAKKIVGSDANYYNRAYWKFELMPNGEDYLIKNVETGRYLFQPGEKIVSEGAERGADDAPGTLGADANYYDRAYWRLKEKED